jgi:predicted membrane protein
MSCLALLLLFHPGRQVASQRRIVVLMISDTLVYWSICISYIHTTVHRKHMLIALKLSLSRHTDGRVRNVQTNGRDKE